jgi:uncharacterized protein (TIGR00255 family)
MTAAVASMTGYARANGRYDGPAGAFGWVWEAKSVNGKGLDVRLRLPPGFDSIELPARQAATAVLTRGSLTIALHVSADAGSAAPRVNAALLDAAIALAMAKAAALPPGALGTTIAPARMDGLLALRGVMDTTEAATLDSDALAARDRYLLASLAGVLDRLNESRLQEGARLAPAVEAHLDEIAALCQRARETAAAQPEALRARCAQQVAELAGAASVTPERLAQEVVLLALKADVREELDRLVAHVAQARELLAKGEPCGRRLDFLSQEFNREANTLCSKSADVGLTRIGLALKTAIDQFREQVQNLE